MLVTGRCQVQATYLNKVEQVLEILSPGDTFGENSLLTRDHYSATLKVITGSELIRIETKGIQQILNKNPKWVHILAEHVGQQMRKFQEKPEPIKLGRIAVLASVSAGVQGDIIVENLAVALRRETSCSVLRVSIQFGKETPSLTDFPTDPYGPFCYSEFLLKGEAGVRQLNFSMSGQAREVDYVAPLMGHLSAHYRFVLVHIFAIYTPAAESKRFL